MNYADSETLRGECGGRRPPLQAEIYKPLSSATLPARRALQLREAGRQRMQGIGTHGFGLELAGCRLHHSLVSKVEEMEAELRKLSKAELRQIRVWLDELIEDELEFTPEFEASIQQAERDMADGNPARVREPDGG